MTAKFFDSNMHKRPKLAFRGHFRPIENSLFSAFFSCF